MSIIIPCFNEERCIVKTITALLKQKGEMIIVNDGSTDDTFNVLREHFRLKPAEFSYPSFIKTKPVYSIYAGKINHHDLFVLNKENGGKADSLNAGINFSHCDTVLCLDADTILEKVIIKDQDALGGRIAIRTDRSLLSLFQSFEYDRSFYYVRWIIDKLNCSFLISGALGIFKKEWLIQIGGYSSDTLAEDMDLIFKLRKAEIENHVELKIRYDLNNLCYTQPVKDYHFLFKQRTRWAYGLIQVLYKYRKMLIDKRYRRLLRMMLLNLLINEMIQPYTEWLSLMIYSVLIINHHYHLFLFFFAINLMINLILDLSICIRRKNKKFIPFLIPFVFFELFYHYYVSLCRLVSPLYMTYKKIRKKNMWGIQDRE